MGRTLKDETCKECVRIGRDCGRHTNRNTTADRGQGQSLKKTADLLSDYDPMLSAGMAGAPSAMPAIPSDRLGTYDTVSGHRPYRLENHVLGDAEIVGDEAAVLDDAVIADEALVTDQATVLDDASVFKKARIAGKARIEGSAQVGGNSFVADFAVVGGNAYLDGHVKIRDKARVDGKAQVLENATVEGNAQVRDSAIVFGYARISDTAAVLGKASVGENVRVSGDGLISGKATVVGNSQVRENAHVTGNAIVAGDADVKGYASIGDGAVIENTRDYIVWSDPSKPQHRNFTVYRAPSAEGGMRVKDGDWTGTVGEAKERYMNSNRSDVPATEMVEFLNMVSRWAGERDWDRPSKYAPKQNS